MAKLLREACRPFPPKDPASIIPCKGSCPDWGLALTYTTDAGVVRIIEESREFDLKKWANAYTTCEGRKAHAAEFHNCLAIFDIRKNLQDRCERVPIQIPRSEEVEFRHLFSSFILGCAQLNVSTERLDEEELREAKEFSEKDAETQTKCLDEIQLNATKECAQLTALSHKFYAKRANREHKGKEREPSSSPPSSGPFAHPRVRPLGGKSKSQRPKFEAQQQQFEAQQQKFEAQRQKIEAEQQLRDLQEKEQQRQQAKERFKKNKARLGRSPFETADSYCQENVDPNIRKNAKQEFTRIRNISLRDAERVSCDVRPEDKPFLTQEKRDLEEAHGLLVEGIVRWEKEWRVKNLASSKPWQTLFLQVDNIEKAKDQHPVFELLREYLASLKEHANALEAFGDLNKKKLEMIEEIEEAEEDLKDLEWILDQQSVYAETILELIRGWEAKIRELEGREAALKKMNELRKNPKRSRHVRNQYSNIIR